MQVFQILFISLIHGKIHLLKTDGKADFMFRMLVAIEGVGLLYEFVVILNLGGGSSPSTGRTRVTSLTGFSMYAGNLEIVELLPFMAGLAGLKARSCSHESGAVCYLGLGLISSFISNTSLLALKRPYRNLLDIWENGFSCTLLS